MIKLDYSLESPEERKIYVEKILTENPELNNNEKYLEILADYMIMCMEKQEKKEKRILTENRMSTVNKRETSFEGLVSQLENGEDGIYNMIKEDKNAIFQPKISITKKDLETIPFLKQLKETIDLWEEKLKTSSGKQAYLIKKSLIEMRKDQYIIKQAYQRPISLCKMNNSSRYFLPLEDTSYINAANGEACPQGVTLLDPKICGAILRTYSKLKEDSWDKFEGDTWYLMQSFDAIAAKALQPYPLYERLVEYKIDGLQNIEIQQLLQEEFGIKHSLEYISSLWRNKIPKLISIAATEEFLTHEYKKQKLPMKKCSRCGQFKPATNNFFSRNSTSKDKLYSICKCCRNKKRG